MIHLMMLNNNNLYVVPKQHLFWSIRTPSSHVSEYLRGKKEALTVALLSDFNYKEFCKGHWPCPISIYTEELSMSPSIFEMSKEYLTWLWIEPSFTAGISFPEICKPSITFVEIKPPLQGKNQTSVVCLIRIFIYVRIEAISVVLGTCWY